MGIPLTVVRRKRFAPIRCLLRDYLFFLRNVRNIIRLKIMCKYADIRDPLQISYNDIRNIHISDNVYIDSKAILRIMKSCRLYIGEGTYIGPFCHIAGTQNRIIIGKKVLLAPRIYISTTNRKYDDVETPIIDQGYVSKGDVVIEDETWIGINSCILSGVKIGKHSIIGANSVVTKDIPSYSLAAGNPAVVIKRYDFENRKWE
jgi:acetyltransferase-like isoleucine patch superfamily enzyme